MPERLIGRRQQGDLGEVSAIEWLTRMGATVLVPIGHSPDFDLVAAANGRLLRVQAKCSTRRMTTPRREERFPVGLATRGGNQSWNGIAKVLDASRLDYLFVLTCDGRRWFIPSTVLEGRTAITLGGPKYAEFEIERGQPIEQLVYGEDPTLESDAAAGEYPSGQRMATVNRPAQPSQVRILPPPFRPRSGFKMSKYDRTLSRAGEGVLNQKRRLTLPRKACNNAGLQDGDRVRVRSEGDGRLIVERIEPPPAAADATT
jgi:hypothetical protein